MKTFLITFLGCFAALLPFYAQNKPDTYLVTGQVTEKTSAEGIPYATIVFITNDSVKSKKMMACDPNGKFTMKLDTAQEFTLTVTAFGFR